MRDAASKAPVFRTDALTGELGQGTMKAQGRTSVRRNGRVRRCRSSLDRADPSLDEFAFDVECAETLDLITRLSQDGLRELLLGDTSSRGMSDNMVSNLAFMAWVDRDPVAAFNFYQMNLAGSFATQYVAFFGVGGG